MLFPCFLNYYFYEQVMMKSVKLEWCLGETLNAKTLLEEATKHYGDFPKVSLWPQVHLCLLN